MGADRDRQIVAFYAANAQKLVFSGKTNEDGRWRAVATKKEARTISKEAETTPKEGSSTPKEATPPSPYPAEGPSFC